MKELYDIIIIGAGPAGLTAALYALRAGKSVLLLEGKAVGGQIVTTNTIKNYPAIPEISGRDFAKNLKEQVKQHGGEIKLEKVVSVASVTPPEDAAKSETIFEVITDLDETYCASSIILATGATPRPLGLKDEERLTGRGVSYCATCDGNFYKDKIVAVNGGGNTALYDAIYLADLAQKVYLIHRRDQFRGDAALVQSIAERENVEFITPAVVTALNGKNTLESITIKYRAEGKSDSPALDHTGKKTPLFADEKEVTIPLDALFVAVGYAPQNDIFKNFVELEDGYIKTSDGVHTSRPHVYVAGDARRKDLKQLTTAVADGAIAATTAVQELQ